MFVQNCIAPFAVIWLGVVLSQPSDLVAGQKEPCWSCLGGAAPAHTLFCGQLDAIACEDECHMDKRTPLPAFLLSNKSIGLRPKLNAPPITTMIRMPYAETYSPAADKYRLVFARIGLPIARLKNVVLFAQKLFQRRISRND